jgi:hypothetical protein
MVLKGDGRGNQRPGAPSRADSQTSARKMSRLAVVSRNAQTPAGAEGLDEKRRDLAGRGGHPGQ